MSLSQSAGNSEAEESEEEDEKDEGEDEWLFFELNVGTFSYDRLQPI